MKEAQNSFHIHFMTEVRRRLLDESVPRAKQCLDLLSEDEIWSKANSNTNSVGNILLHLCGNARQWVCSGLNHQPDVRNREDEFTCSRIPKSDLIRKLDDLARDVDLALRSIDKSSLTARHRVQGFSETGVGILIHAVEHFSYHVGQITYAVKFIKDIDTNFYKGIDLNQRG